MLCIFPAFVILGKEQISVSSVRALYAVGKGSYVVFFVIFFERNRHVSGQNKGDNTGGYIFSSYYYIYTSFLLCFEKMPLTYCP